MKSTIQSCIVFVLICDIEFFHQCKTLFIYIHFPESHFVLLQGEIKHSGFAIQNDLRLFFNIEAV